MKRTLLAALAAALFAWQLWTGAAAALQLDDEARTVVLSEDGESVVITLKETKRGQQLFGDICAQCHKGGANKANPNIDLSPEIMAGAEPARDNVESLIDYIKHPTTYDGEIDISELHPCTERSDLFGEMRNLSEDDLYALSGYILMQPNTNPLWAASKAYL